MKMAKEPTLTFLNNSGMGPPFGCPLKFLNLPIFSKYCRLRLYTIWNDTCLLTWWTEKGLIWCSAYEWSSTVYMEISTDKAIAAKPLRQWCGWEGEVSPQSPFLRPSLLSKSFLLWRAPKAEAIPASSPHLNCQPHITIFISFSESCLSFCSSFRKSTKRDAEMEVEKRARPANQVGPQEVPYIIWNII